MAGRLATEVELDAVAVQGLVEGVRGPVLRPGDPGYDDARAIWNGLIDRGGELGRPRADRRRDRVGPGVLGRDGPALDRRRLPERPRPRRGEGGARQGGLRP